MRQVFMHHQNTAKQKLKSRGIKYLTSKLLLDSFLLITVEWAGLSVRYSFWAKAYYWQKATKGKPHNTIIRTLALSGYKS